MTEQAEKGSYHVVVLDDADATSKLVALALRKRLDCRVTLLDKREGLEGLEAGNSVDLFLLDFYVDRKEGVEVCRQFKEREDTRDVPVMFFSEHGEPKLRAAAIRAGGIDYLEKPFFPDELVARVQSHIELHRSRQQILAQLSEQQALMRVLCHDLLNPVAAVESVLRLLEDCETGQEELLDLARDANRSALQLIHHVRDYRSLSDTGELFDEERLNLAEAVGESLRIVGSMADGKDLSLRTLVEEGTRIQINKVVLVHNILNNLLTNAIKFSEKGQEVRIRGWEGEEKGKRYCYVHVEDDGIGIPDDVQHDLFSPSRGRSRLGTEAETGTGFGMPLVKLYVEKSHGLISVESHTAEEAERPWVGTRIRMRFPFPEGE